MKVLLIKDVYKLGRAGDVKKVADGYGRNFLLTRKLAVLATPGTLKTAERIRSQGEVRRAALNSELKDLAEHINGVTVTFAAKAGETGKLYGSITTAQIAEAIGAQTGQAIDRRQIGHQPLRELGEHKIPVRLTADLVPEVTVLIHREGESVKEALAKVEAAATEEVEEIQEEATPEAAALGDEEMEEAEDLSSDEESA